MDWIEAQWPTTYDEKYGTRALPISSLNKLSREKNKPSLIYVYRADDEKTADREAKMFGTADVVLGSRFFRCFRIADEDLPEGKIRDKYLMKKGPSFIILDAKGNEVSRNTKPVTSRWIFTKMKQQYKADFGGSISKQIKKLTKWLDDLEKAEDRMADAEKAFRSAEDRLDKKESPATKKRAEKTKKAFDDMVKAFEKLVDFGVELSTPKLKAQPTAKK